VPVINQIVSAIRNGTIKKSYHELAHDLLQVSYRLLEFNWLDI
jgi:hypothetical protein